MDDATKGGTDIIVEGSEVAGKELGWHCSEKVVHFTNTQTAAQNMEFHLRII